ncbi:MAG TPA: hypothetical protein VMK12_29045, partial [Anaeromyxobacteraceae bacterium]|nr:hypothetical protein [Anaeromyxobacteraceae bacterium]
MATHVGRARGENAEGHEPAVSRGSQGESPAVVASDFQFCTLTVMDRVAGVGRRGASSGFLATPPSERARCSDLLALPVEGALDADSSLTSLWEAEAVR